MAKKTDFTVRVSLVVRADTPQEAEAYADKRILESLQKWYNEDIGYDGSAPYPHGSLLFYSIGVEK